MAKLTERQEKIIADIMKLDSLRGSAGVHTSQETQDIFHSITWAVLVELFELKNAVVDISDHLMNIAHGSTVIKTRETL